MFRERPLTCLFIVATITVDVVFVSLGEIEELAESLEIGFVLGQLAALAIWTVRGSTNRLARMSCLVVATGGLTHLMDSDPFGTWLAFNSGYVCWLVLVTLVSDVIRHRLNKADASNTTNARWQVSLMEMFGWTIVVAITSFGARYMRFVSLQQNDAWLLICAFLAVPTSISIFIWQDLRDLRSWRALALIIVILTAATTISKEVQTGEYAIVLQSAYLLLWMAILAIENIGSTMNSVRESSAEQEISSDTPKLFDPQD